MRATLSAIVVAVLVGVVGVPRSAATEAGPAGAEKVSPMLGVSYRSPGGRLAWFDPLTLQTLPGRKASLGGHTGSWAFSANRAVLAIASCGDGESGDLRFVNARAMRVLGNLRLSPSADCASSLTWLGPRRLLAVVHTPSDTSVVLVDPVARRILRRSQLPAYPAAIGRTDEELVLLLAPNGKFAPARLAVVDTEGSVRVRTVESILTGTVVDDTSPDYRARTIQPGLAVDPDSRRAVVVPASGPVAEVDLGTLAVSYHELDRPSLLGRFLRWLTPAAQAKLVEGPVRNAWWLGSGSVAVSGTDYSIDPRNGDLRLVQTPAGLRLIDTRSWTSRWLEPRASGFTVGPDLVVAQGGGWDSELERRIGPGLRAFGIDGRERSKLYSDEYRWMDSAGSIGYAYSDGGRADVVDLETGTVLARVVGVGDPLPQLLAGQASNW